MNDLDMELQTIRQKLQNLKATPPEPLSSPWGQSRLAAPSPNLAQVTTAIETLRQRSHQTSAPSLPGSSLQQFDAALSTIENLAQRQQEALRRLKSLADGLTEQIQPGTSPDVDDIARFFAQHQTIQIPIVQRDRDGYLDWVYHTIDFSQATHDATANAATLRRHSSQLFKNPVDQSQGADIGLDNSPYEALHDDSVLDNLSHFYQVGYRAIQHWIHRFLSTDRNTRPSQFTLLDSAIWCIGAAIARIILHQLLQSYPPLWTPIALILIGGIILNLYRAIFSLHPKPVLGYRTLMVILGLLLGGRFL